MTGRGAGYCAGYGMPGFANQAGGRGFGAGFVGGRAFGGSGRGWRNCFYATGLPGWARFGGYPQPAMAPDPAMEKQALQAQADALEAQLEMLRQRLGALDSGTQEA
jgi:hypothetical protein